MRTKGDAGLKFTNNQGWMLEVRKIEKMIVKVRVMARDGRWRILELETKVHPKVRNHGEGTY